MAARRPSQAIPADAPPRRVIPCSWQNCAEPAFCSVKRVNLCRTHYYETFNAPRLGREPGSDDA